MLSASRTGSAVELDQHVAVRPGPGLVGRFADTVIVVAGEDNESTDGRALMAAVEAESAPGRSALDLARRLAALLVAGDGPDFGLVAPFDDRLVILLHGAVHAEVGSPAGALSLSGQDSLTWLDRSVELPVDRVDVHLEATALPADVRSDLRGGRVPGGGFVLSFAGPPPTAPVAPVEDSSRLGEPTGAPRPATTPPAKIPEAAPAPTQATMLSGTVAGLAPRRETVVRSGQASALVADDGKRIPLDRSYVLGREPHHDPSVESGAAAPIVVDDPDSLISRVHVYVSVQADEVTVRDARSANGTFVAAAGTSEWTELDDQATPLPVGWCLRIGKRVYNHVGPPS